MHKTDGATDGYRLVSEFRYSIHEARPKRRVLGSKEERVCCVCGRDESSASFRKEAHVLPASLGNRMLFTTEECDICNETIGHYESELTQFLSLERVLMRGFKRQGRPKIRPGRYTYIRSTPGSNEVELFIDAQEADIISISDLGNNTMELAFKQVPKCSAEGICKAVTHSAWVVMAELQRERISYISEWLLGKVVIDVLHFDIITLPGQGTTNVTLEIWESGNDIDENYPFIVRFLYRRQILGFYVPLHNKVSIDPLRFRVLNLCAPIKEIQGHTYSCPFSARISPPRNIRFSYEYCEGSLPPSN